MLFIIILIFLKMNEEPPFIKVGADVSAKFKGAFCEAKVKSAKKFIKCKVNNNFFKPVDFIVC